MYDLCDRYGNIIGMIENIENFINILKKIYKNVKCYEKNNGIDQCEEYIISDGIETLFIVGRGS